MHEEVLNFWFREITPKQWWVKDTDFDSLIRTRFLGLHQAAHAGELYEWRKTAHGRLAEVIVLDQFSRNMFRDTPAAFASDPVALILAQEALAQGADQSLGRDERSFLYLPYMHSESRKIHQSALVLYENLGDPDKLDFELRHKKIIDEFGRYPHRNAILGRESTGKELEFLKLPGSGF